jgi:RNA polymerase sigma-70 factor (ECF subfamily)
VLAVALHRGQVGPYQLQAAIAAEHAVAAVANQTDWAEIARLYALLARAAPSPVIELNRAVAVAMADGPAAGLTLLEPLERSGALAGYYLLPASIGDLLRRLGRRAQAAENYRAAIALAPSDAERRFLTRRLEEVAPIQ